LVAEQPANKQTTATDLRDFSPQQSANGYEGLQADLAG
jgi:hypothetical protein